MHLSKAFAQLFTFRLREMNSENVEKDEIRIKRDHEQSERYLRDVLRRTHTKHPKTIPSSEARKYQLNSFHPR